MGGRRLSAVLGAAIVAVAGCGALPGAAGVFPDRLVDLDGNTVFLEDLLAISADASLDDEQKRDRFIELGVEDPDLIDALISG